MLDMSENLIKFEYQLSYEVNQIRPKTQLNKTPLNTVVTSHVTIKKTTKLGNITNPIWELTMNHYESRNPN